jgi:hypothetical protein
MTKAKQLEQLEQECHKRGVKLIYDDLRSEGGLCRLRGCYYLILNRRLASETKARIIADALERVQAMMESRPVASEPVPSAAPEPTSEPVPVAEPLAASRPEPEYEEPEVGIPVAAGVPDSHN